MGYFMNDAPHIGSIHATVNRIWAQPGKKPKIDVQFIGKTTVLFRIEDAAIRNRVLGRKFWHISEVPLMVGVWSPETASSPPDLSAIPLWVDLAHVPGYLYSKKGLSFLSRTAGKFIKLHPSTERCIRMDVARVLVEVDLTKPLPRKISLKGRHGEDVLISIAFSWLPPHCSSCARWGHLESNCTMKEKSSNTQQEAERTTQNDSVVMEGFSSKEVPETLGAVIMTKLMAELESISSGKNLSNITPSVNEAEQVRGNSIEKGTGERSGVNEWAIISGHSGAPALTPPGNNIETCLSPNGFQVLQDIREEGEIDEEDDDEDSESEVKSVEDCEKQTAPPSPSRTVTPLVTDSVENIPGTAPQRQSSAHRSRGRGAKRTIVNSRSLVQAVTQQQKGSQHAKKAFSRKY